MADKCIKCKNLTKEVEQYPCNSCKELGNKGNRLISHYEDKK